MTAPALPQDIAIVWVDSIGSDWLGIYVDGDKVYEGHPPSAAEALGVIDIPYVERTIDSDQLRLPGIRGLPLRLPRSTS